MRNIVVFYFHGYGSSAANAAPKVNRLAAAGFDTYAWDIDIHTEQSIPFLCRKINDVLIDYLHVDPAYFYCVGTSLGGWYAAKLGSMYGMKSILVNPSYAPKLTLPKLGVQPDQLVGYNPIRFNKLQTVICADDDDLIDFNNVDFGDATAIRSPTGGHRFSGPEFNLVIDRINQLSITTQLVKGLS